MKKEEKNQLAVIPTAELLADMELLVVFGGKNDNDDKGDSFVVSNCDSFKASYCNCTFKDGGNCVAGCACSDGGAGITIGGLGGGPITHFP